MSSEGFPPTQQSCNPSSGFIRGAEGVKDSQGQDFQLADDRSRIETKEETPMMTVFEYGGDTPSLGKKTVKRTLYSRFILDWWLWEVAANFLSVVAVAAIVAILVAYDTKEIPELSHGITLNAIISILANLARASLLVAIAAAISQLKWLWFQDKRSLHDLQVFDDASRGPGGALSMIIHLRGRHLASIGAFIAFASIAFEPFVQQLILYPVRTTYTTSDTALVKQADYLTFVHQRSGRFDVDLLIEQGIANALFNGDSAPRILPSCPTGNCTWPTFNSLGVCSKCVDMTDSVGTRGACTVEDLLQTNMTNTTCAFSFPYGVPFINPYKRSTEPLSLIAWMLNYKPVDSRNAIFAAVNGTYAGVQNPLFALGWLELDYNSSTAKNPISKGLECMFTFCLKSYNVSMMSGKLSSVATPTHLASMDQDSGWNVSAPLMGHGPDPNVTFDVHYSAGYHVWERLMEQLPGNATTWSDDISVYMPSSTYMAILNDGDNLPHMLENVALSITDSLLKTSNKTVVGSVGNVKQYVRVRWAWISFPIFLVLSTALFLLLTMVGSHKNGIKLWKSSSLALLYHGLDNPSEDSASINRTSGMDEDAKGVSVRLARTEGDQWRLRRADLQAWAVISNRMDENQSTPRPL
ncbi:MAG: hypothetical protein M1830_010243 [Pleopsidium flavum]|nr:MAG: hypothetical protein M1830_010243 [Pleopsidium flavum]